MLLTSLKFASTVGEELRVCAAANLMTQPFSVTNVRVAFECPRLFYLGLRPAKTMFLPKGTPGGIGKAFHDLSEDFVLQAKVEPRFRLLLEPDLSGLGLEAIATQLRQLFYDLVFFPYLQTAIQTDPGKAPALYQLWQSLTRLIRRWAQLLISNRRYCSAAEVISKTFLAQELKVKHYFDLPNGTRQQVVGQFDSLVYDFAQQRLCVVEYKTYASVDQAAQLAQVALYSYMLRETIGVPIDSALYSVLPDWKELTFTWEELARSLYQIIPGRLQQMQQWAAWQPGQPDPPPATAYPERLCDICPQHRSCQTLFEPALQPFISADAPPLALPPEPPPLESVPLAPQTVPLAEAAAYPSAPPLDDSTSAAADATGATLVSTLAAFGLRATYEGAAIGPAFIRIKLKPHPGVKVGSIMRLSDDLRVQLGLEAPPLIAPQAGYVSVDLPRPERQVAEFYGYLQRQTLPPAAPIQIAIGVNLDGRLVQADLADPNTCHFLVGGTTGSGKSEFLRSLLLSLLVRHGPDQLQIALVDPKRVTFPEFEQVPWLYAPVVKDGDRAIELMDDLMTEMDRRYQQFEVAGCQDLRGYNQRPGRQPLPRIVCIFDEYADFMAEKETRSALEFSIKRLGAMARAAGIHLIVATQRPEAKVVTPIIRSNLPGRIALRTASEADSTIVLGGKQIEAAYLLGKGDLLYQKGAQLLRLQSLFAPHIRL